MADWRNRMDQIFNKVKAQLFAKGVDNMNQLQEHFLVSLSAPSMLALIKHGRKTLIILVKYFERPDMQLRGRMIQILIVFCLPMDRASTATRMESSKSLSSRSSCHSWVSSSPDRSCASSSITSTRTRMATSHTLNLLAFSG